MATYPLEHVHIDFITIKVDKTDEHINVLLINDHLTCYAQAFITPSQTTNYSWHSVGQSIHELFEFSEKILSDQGDNFKSKLITELCSLACTKKLYTMPYRL